MEILRSIGRALKRWWMAFAKGLAFANTVVLLTIIYIILIGPSWLVMKLRGKDLLEQAAGSEGSYWKTKDPVPHTVEQSLHQF